MRFVIIKEFISVISFYSIGILFKKLLFQARYTIANILTEISIIILHKPAQHYKNEYNYTMQLQSKHSSCRI